MIMTIPVHDDGWFERIRPEWTRHHCVLWRLFAEMESRGVDLNALMPIEQPWTRKLFATRFSEEPGWFFVPMMRGVRLVGYVAFTRWEPAPAHIHFWADKTVPWREILRFGAVTLQQATEYWGELRAVIPAEMEMARKLARLLGGVEGPEGTFCWRRAGSVMES